jgi:hypothetical protein
MKYNLNGKVYISYYHCWLKHVDTYLSGLIGNLRTCLPNMFKFYSYLKDYGPQVLLLTKEKKIASDNIKLSSAKLTKIMQCHDAHQQSLKNIFTWQQEKAIVHNILLYGHFLFTVSSETLKLEKV